MAENEKITPEAAEEVKAEEVKTEAPAEEKKEAPKAKKANKALPAIIAAAVVAVLVVAFVVVAFVMGSSAINAYGAKDYEGAYNNSKLALFVRRRQERNQRSLHQGSSREGKEVLHRS